MGLLLLDSGDRFERSTEQEARSNLCVVEDSAAAPPRPHREKENNIFQCSDS